MEASRLDTIKICLAVAEKGDVSRLLSKHGYSRNSVTPELVLKAIEEKGEVFGKELANVCRMGLQNPVTANRLASYTGLSYATGEGEGTITPNTGSTSVNASSTFDWFDRVFSFLEKGIVTAPSIINGLDVSGANSANAAANKTIAEMLLAKENTKSNTGLYIALGVVLLVVVGVIVYVVKRKK